MGRKPAGQSNSPEGCVVQGQSSGMAACSSASRARLTVSAPWGVPAEGAGRHRASIAGPAASRTRLRHQDEAQRAKHAVKLARAGAAAAKASAQDAARAGRLALAVAAKNKKPVVKRCMCQMTWCQSTNTVDTYGHKLKSRSAEECLSWLTTLRPGDSAEDLKARASNPGNLRATLRTSVITTRNGVRGSSGNTCG